MISSKSKSKMKQTLLAGVSLLALAAVGCGGGGGGTLVNPPQLIVGQGANASIGTVGGTRKALNRISTAATVQVYSIDGTLIDEAAGVTLPYTYEFSNNAKSSATNQGSLVFRAFTATQDYTTVTKLSSGDLSTNGPIQENGANRVEPTDAGSTVRTALIESELEAEVGAPVKLGAKASATTAAKLKTLAESADSGVAVDELADTLKTAANTAGSLLSEVVASVGAQVNTSATANSRDSIAKFLKTGRSKTSTSATTAGALSKLKKMRKLMKVSAKLSKQVKKLRANASRLAKVKTFLASVATSTDAVAGKRAAGADVVASSLEISQNTDQAAFGNAVNSMLDNADDLDEAIVKAGNEVLTNLTPDVIQSAANNGAAGEISGLVAGVITGNSESTTTATTAEKAAKAKALEALSTAVQVIPGKAAKNEFLGKALAASSENKGAAGDVLTAIATANNNLDASEQVNVGEAIKEVAEEVDAGSLVLVVADVISDLGAGSAAIDGLFDGSASVDNLVGAIASDLDAESLTVIKDSATGLSANVISDNVKIDGLASVKTGDFVLLSNASLETQTGTYSYTWNVPAGAANGSVTSDDDTASFTAAATAGTHNITLTQSYNGSAVRTATFTLTVAATLPPVVDVAPASTTIKVGQAGAVLVSVTDPETGRTLTNTATVGSTCGSNTSGFTVGSLASSGGILSVAVGSSVAAGTYCGRVTASPSTGSAVSKDFTVIVPAVAATKVFISGAVNGLAGTNVTISAVAIQEATPATTATVKLFVNTDGSVAGTPDATAALGVGFTNLSTTKSAIAAGNYTVTVVVTNGANVVTQTAKFAINAAGAPSIDSVKANGAPIAGSVTFVTGSTLNLDVDVTATSSTTIQTYQIVVTGSNNTNVTTSASSGTAIPVVSNLGAGTYNVRVNVSNSSATASQEFSMTVVQKKEIVVNSVSLTGNNVSGNPSASAAAGVYTVDASGVTGIDLNQTSGLVFGIAADQNASAVGSDFQISVTLSGATGVQSANLTVTNATLATSGNGYDVTGASTLLFSGTKGDGSEAQVSSSSSNISNFDAMFTASATGIDVNINELRTGMIAVLGTNSFASSLSNLTGSNLTLTVSVSGSNFNFKSGNVEFNTFRITGINVQ